MDDPADPRDTQGGKVNEISLDSRCWIVAAVGVELVANQAIAKERSAVFGGKDCIDDYFG